MILYFLLDSLSWQSFKTANQKQKKKPILKMKKIISTRDFCDDLSKKFAIYFDHVDSLDVDDKLKYSYLRKIFRNLFIREDFKYDQMFDWTILRYLMTIQDDDALIWKSCIRSFFREYSKIKQKAIVIALTTSVIRSFSILSFAITTCTWIQISVDVYFRRLFWKLRMRWICSCRSRLILVILF